MKALLHLFRPAYVRRFREIARQEGLRPALRKAVHRVSLALKGKSAPEALSLGGTRHSTKYQLSGFWSEMARSAAFHVKEAPAIQRRTRRIAVIGDLNLPQCRKYRVEQLQELWQRGGVELDYSHYEDVPRAIASLQSATHLLFYRLRASDLASMYLYEARRLRLPVVYDIDDPLFSVSAYETYGNMTAVDGGLKQHFMQEAPGYLDVMNACDAVSLSTPGLVDHARLYTRRPIFLRRNFADRESLKAGAAARHGRADKGEAANAPFTVAFASGSQGHEVDFRIMRDDMIAFLQGHPDRRLLILGHFPKDSLPEELAEQIRYEPFTTYETYLQNLAAADCAVMPLADDLFNRCKSGVRVIDAASVGLACVVGRVGDMATMVQHEETGLVVGPQDSWLSALEELAGNPGRTARMGDSARHNLEIRWSARLEEPVTEKGFAQWVLE